MTIYSGVFKAPADAIAEKMGNNEIDLGNRGIAHFIDCNCLPSSVVGGVLVKADTHRNA